MLDQENYNECTGQNTEDAASTESPAPTTEHSFMESRPENYNSVPDEAGASDNAEAMCEGCCGLMDNLTEAYITCITCDKS